MEKVCFDSNIVAINNRRFQITIPKVLVDAGVVDPKKPYEVVLRERVLV